MSFVERPNQRGNVPGLFIPSLRGACYLPAPFELNYFEVLPLHPEPRSFESLTSYLMRIAQANAISHPFALPKILGVTIGELTRLPAYSPLSIGNIAVRIMCVPERLKACTLFHLERKFGRRRSDPASTPSSFLRSSLSPSLRYCPLCLADDLYYSLKWRFLPVAGCSTHRCRLLDRCAHCESALPLFVYPPKLGVCLSCGGYLRSCPVQWLAEQEMRTVHDRTGDIEFLLSQNPCEEDDDMLRRIGCRFAALRREKLLSVQDMADAIGIPLYEVMKIERGDAGRYVSFDGYLRYAAYLGKTLQEVFLESAVQDRAAASALHGMLSAEAGGRQSLHEEHESIVLEQV